MDRVSAALRTVDSTCAHCVSNLGRRLWRVSLLVVVVASLVGVVYALIEHEFEDANVSFDLYSSPHVELVVENCDLRLASRVPDSTSSTAPRDALSARIVATRGRELDDFVTSTTTSSGVRRFVVSKSRTPSPIRCRATLYLPLAAIGSASPQLLPNVSIRATHSEATSVQASLGPHGLHVLDVVSETNVDGDMEPVEFESFTITGTRVDVNLASPISTRGALSVSLNEGSVVVNKLTQSAGSTTFLKTLRGDVRAVFDDATMPEVPLTFENSIPSVCLLVPDYTDLQSSCNGTSILASSSTFNSSAPDSERELCSGSVTLCASSGSCSSGVTEPSVVISVRGGSLRSSFDLDSPASDAVYVPVDESSASSSPSASTSDDLPELILSPQDIAVLDSVRDFIDRVPDINSVAMIDVDQIRQGRFIMSSARAVIEIGPHYLAGLSASILNPRLRKYRLRLATPGCACSVPGENSTTVPASQCTLDSVVSEFGDPLLVAATEVIRDGADASLTEIVAFRSLEATDIWEALPSGLIDSDRVTLNGNVFLVAAIVISFVLAALLAGAAVGVLYFTTRHLIHERNMRRHAFQHLRLQAERKDKKITYRERLEQRRSEQELKALDPGIPHPFRWPNLMWVVFQRHVVSSSLALFLRERRDQVFGIDETRDESEAATAIMDTDDGTTLPDPPVVQPASAVGDAKARTIPLERFLAQYEMFCAEHGVAEDVVHDNIATLDYFDVTLTVINNTDTNILRHVKLYPRNSPQAKEKAEVFEASYGSGDPPALDSLQLFLRLRCDITPFALDWVFLSVFEQEYHRFCKTPSKGLPSAVVDACTDVHIHQGHRRFAAVPLTEATVAEHTLEIDHGTSSCLTYQPESKQQQLRRRIKALASLISKKKRSKRIAGETTAETEAQAVQEAEEAMEDDATESVLKQELNNSAGIEHKHPEHTTFWTRVHIWLGTFTMPDYVHDVALVFSHMIGLLVLPSVLVAITIYVQINYQQGVAVRPEHEPTAYDTANRPWRYVTEFFGNELLRPTMVAIAAWIVYISIGIIELCIFYLFDVLNDPLATFRRNRSFFSYKWPDMLRLGLQRFFFFLVLFYLWACVGYLFLVAIWFILGSILSPSAYLPYGSAAAAFIGFAIHKAQSLRKMRREVQAIIEERIREMLNTLAQASSSMAGFRLSGLADVGGDVLRNAAETGDLKGALLGAATQNAQQLVALPIFASVTNQLGVDPVVLVRILALDEEAIHTWSRDVGVDGQLIIAVVATAHSQHDRAKQAMSKVVSSVVGRPVPQGFIDALVRLGGMAAARAKQRGTGAKASKPPKKSVLSTATLKSFYRTAMQALDSVTTKAVDAASAPGAQGLLAQRISALVERLAASGADVPLPQDLSFSDIEDFSEFTLDFFLAVVAAAHGDHAPLLEFVSKQCSLDSSLDFYRPMLLRAHGGGVHQPVPQPQQLEQAVEEDDESTATFVALPPASSTGPTPAARRFRMTEDDVLRAFLTQHKITSEGADVLIEQRFDFDTLVAFVRARIDSLVRLLPGEKVGHVARMEAYIRNTPSDALREARLSIVRGALEEFEAAEALKQKKQRIAELRERESSPAPEAVEADREASAQANALTKARQAAAGEDLLPLLHSYALSEEDCALLNELYTLKSLVADAKKSPSFPLAAQVQAFTSQPNTIKHFVEALVHQPLKVVKRSLRRLSQSQTIIQRAIRSKLETHSALAPALGTLISMYKLGAKRPGWVRMLTTIFSDYLGFPRSLVAPVVQIAALSRADVADSRETTEFFVQSCNIQAARPLARLVVELVSSPPHQLRDHLAKLISNADQHDSADSEAGGRNCLPSEVTLSSVAKTLTLFLSPAPEPLLLAEHLAKLTALPKKAFKAASPVVILLEKHVKSSYVEIKRALKSMSAGAETITLVTAVYAASYQAYKHSKSESALGTWVDFARGLLDVLSDNRGAVPRDFQLLETEPEAVFLVLRRFVVETLEETPFQQQVMNMLLRLSAGACVHLRDLNPTGEEVDLLRLNLGAFVALTEAFVHMRECGKSMHDQCTHDCLRHVQDQFEVMSWAFPSADRELAQLVPACLHAPTHPNVFEPLIRYVCRDPTVNKFADRFIEAFRTDYDNCRVLKRERRKVMKHHSLLDTALLTIEKLQSLPTPGYVHFVQQDFAGLMSKLFIDAMAPGSAADQAFVDKTGFLMARLSSLALRPNDMHAVADTLLATFEFQRGRGGETAHDTASTRALVQLMQNHGKPHLFNDLQQFLRTGSASPTEMSLARAVLTASGVLIDEEAFAYADELARYVADNNLRRSGSGPPVSPTGLSETFMAALITLARAAASNDAAQVDISVGSVLSDDLALRMDTGLCRGLLGMCRLSLPLARPLLQALNIPFHHVAPLMALCSQPPAELFSDTSTERAGVQRLLSMNGMWDVGQSLVWLLRGKPSEWLEFVESSTLGSVPAATKVATELTAIVRGEMNAVAANMKPLLKALNKSVFGSGERLTRDQALVQVSLMRGKTKLLRSIPLRLPSLAQVPTLKQHGEMLEEVVRFVFMMRYRSEDLDHDARPGLFDNGHLRFFLPYPLLNLVASLYRAFSSPNVFAAAKPRAVDDNQWQQIQAAAEHAFGHHTATSQRSVAEATGDLVDELAKVYLAQSPHLGRQRASLHLLIELLLKHQHGSLAERVERGQRLLHLVRQGPCAKHGVYSDAAVHVILRALVLVTRDAQTFRALPRPVSAATAREADLVIPLLGEDPLVVLSVEDDEEDDESKDNDDEEDDDDDEAKQDDVEVCEAQAEPNSVPLGFVEVVLPWVELGDMEEEHHRDLFEVPPTFEHVSPAVFSPKISELMTGLYALMLPAYPAANAKLSAASATGSRILANEEVDTAKSDTKKCHPLSCCCCCCGGSDDESDSDNPRLGYSYSTMCLGASQGGSMVYPVSQHMRALHTLLGCESDLAVESLRGLVMLLKGSSESFALWATGLGLKREEVEVVALGIAERHSIDALFSTTGSATEVLKASRFLGAANCLETNIGWSHSQMVLSLRLCFACLTRDPNMRLRRLDDLFCKPAPLGFDAPLPLVAAQRLAYPRFAHLRLRRHDLQHMIHDLLHDKAYELFPETRPGARAMKHRVEAAIVTLHDTYQTSVEPWWSQPIFSGWHALKCEECAPQLHVYSDVFELPAVPQPATVTERIRLAEEQAGSVPGVKYSSSEYLLCRLARAFGVLDGVSGAQERLPALLGAVAPARDALLLAQLTTELIRDVKPGRASSSMLEVMSMISIGHVPTWAGEDSAEVLTWSHWRVAFRDMAGIMLEQQDDVHWTDAGPVALMLEMLVLCINGSAQVIQSVADWLVTLGNQGVADEVEHKRNMQLACHFLSVWAQGNGRASTGENDVVSSWKRPASIILEQHLPELASNVADAILPADMEYMRNLVALLFGAGADGQVSGAAQCLRDLLPRVVPAAAWKHIRDASLELTGCVENAEYEHRLDAAVALLRAVWDGRGGPTATYEAGVRHVLDALHGALLAPDMGRNEVKKLLLGLLGQTSARSTGEEINPLGFSLGGADGAFNDAALAVVADAVDALVSVGVQPNVDKSDSRSAVTWASSVVAAICSNAADGVEELGVTLHDMTAVATVVSGVVDQHTAVSVEQADLLLDSVANTVARNAGALDTANAAPILAAVLDAVGGGRDANLELARSAAATRLARRLASELGIPEALGAGVAVALGGVATGKSASRLSALVQRLLQELAGPTENHGAVMETLRSKSDRLEAWLVRALPVGQDVKGKSFSTGLHADTLLVLLLSMGHTADMNLTKPGMAYAVSGTLSASLFEGEDGALALPRLVSSMERMASETVRAVDASESRHAVLRQLGHVDGPELVRADAMLTAVLELARGGARLAPNREDGVSFTALTAFVQTCLADDPSGVADVFAEAPVRAVLTACSALLHQQPRALVRSVLDAVAASTQLVVGGDVGTTRGTVLHTAFHMASSQSRSFYSVVGVVHAAAVVLLGDAEAEALAELRGLHQLLSEPIDHLSADVLTILPVLVQLDGVQEQGHELLMSMLDRVMFADRLWRASLGCISTLISSELEDGIENFTSLFLLVLEKGIESQSARAQRLGEFGVNVMHDMALGMARKDGVLVASTALALADELLDIPKEVLLLIRLAMSLRGDGGAGGKKKGKGKEVELRVGSSDLGGDTPADIVANLFGIPAPVARGLLGLAQQDLSAVVDLAEYLGCDDTKKLAALRFLISRVVSSSGKGLPSPDDLLQGAKSAYEGKGEDGGSGGSGEGESGGGGATKASIDSGEVFALFDPEGSGFLDFEGFRAVLKYLNLEVSETKAMQVFIAASGPERHLDQTQYEHAMKLVREQLTSQGLSLAGLSWSHIVTAFVGSLTVLFMLLIFIFLGINAFSPGGAFGAVINSILSMGAALGLGAGEQDVGEVLENLNIDALVRKIFALLRNT